MKTLISKQQRFMLDVINRLGCIRKDQLSELVKSEFCSIKPEVAPRLVNSAMNQLLYGNVQIRRDGEVYRLPHVKPDPKLLEAIDVMLELGGAMLIDYRAGAPPVLLRFVVEGEKVRSFTVLPMYTDVGNMHIDRTERIILLFDGQGQPSALPVSNKQFLAIRQENGSHRFAALAQN